MKTEERFFYYINPALGIKYIRRIDIMSIPFHKNENKLGVGENTGCLIYNGIYYQVFCFMGKTWGMN